MMERKKTMHLVLGGCALMFLVLLVSCMGPKQTINYEPVTDRKFEPSRQPAQITALTASQLKAQGYIKIGDLYVEQVSIECYEDMRFVLVEPKPGTYSLDKKDFFHFHTHYLKVKAA